MELEDQTDEGFFNKLVDDELEGVGSESVPRDVTRAFGNVGLDDRSAVDGEGRKELCSVSSVQLGRQDGLAGGDTVPSEEHAVDKKVPTCGYSDADVVGTETPSSLGGERDTSESGTKVVQWSAFCSAVEEQELGAFGSFTDFTLEGSSEASFELESHRDPKAGSAGSPVLGTTVTDTSAHFSSVEHAVQEDNMNFKDTSLSRQGDVQLGREIHDPQCWENLYPGWKYEFNTGQWYQVDRMDSTSIGNVDGHETLQNAVQGFHGDDVHDLAGEANFDRISDVSYLQQTSQSVEQTMTDSLTATNLNQGSQERTEYPSNMVFDPQYPGWYYDTSTSEWYSLESYTQSGQLMTSMDHDQIIPGEPEHVTSDRLLDQSGNLRDNGWHNLIKNQTIQGGLANSYLPPDVCQHDVIDGSQSSDAFSGNHPMENLYGSPGLMGSNLQPQGGFNTVSHLGFGKSSSPTASFQGFNTVENTYQFNQLGFEHSQHQDKQIMMGHSQQLFQSERTSLSHLSFAPKEERSSAGCPPHALVTFGFGGKLIVMKETSANLALGSQGAYGGIISVLNLMDVVAHNNGSSIIGEQSHNYFHALCSQSFPGPLVGATFSAKDLNKWIDERITGCESPYLDLRKGELLRLLLLLLKLSYQHYGKLRSPFGPDMSLLETGGSESEVTKLFADAARTREYGSFTSCLCTMPSSGQIQATAAEVQNLLVAGKRTEALQCAQEGMLWGPALVLAAQLGEKFYTDTVKQMAHYQLVCGSPLRTLCLLIAGQPADVFSTNNPRSNLPDGANAAGQGIGNGILDNWEENLAVITANRTKDDELVMVHLGDCLWKERGEITAAHTCYLVADAKFESYSDTARLCLVGADHWKCPRTYASPEAIQRTEFYEYSKVHGNPQFVLLPFQPYKLLYAYMLAEVGKISDSLRYCQAILKLLKNTGRAPEIETWKQLASSLDERLQTHQQGGYGTTLAPAKFVGKIFTTIDRSISRIIGSPPPSEPPTFPSNIQSVEHDSLSGAPRVANGQSTMAMPSLMASASVETISERTGDNRWSMHSRSASEPNFVGSSKKMSPSDDSSTDGQSKLSRPGGSSRLGRFGSQLFQKTVEWVSRSHTGRQAKLGEQNKFYYDEKLKRWVEEGTEPPSEETPLPPPPTSFQNDTSDYNINAAFRSQTTSTNRGMETKPSISTDHSPGIPPIPPGQNQFSARGRMGVRSRYVDTFNKGASASSFQSPTIPLAKPINASKLFIPAPVFTTQSTGNGTPDVSSTERGFSTITSSFPSSPSSHPMPNYPSMDNIPSVGKKEKGSGSEDGNNSYETMTRAASWGGFSEPLQNKSFGEFSPLPEGGRQRSLPLPHQNRRFPQDNGGNLGEYLHEVEL